MALTKEQKLKAYKKRHPLDGEQCICGNVIYWTRRYGYRCMCNNPRPYTQKIISVKSYENSKLY